MRNRQMIVHWLMAHTSAIDVRQRDGKTYFVMTDAAAFRDGVGRLLAEVQRIKGEGDYAAARRSSRTYGVHFDPALRDEVVARVDALKLPSYTGFVMPRLEAGARRRRRDRRRGDLVSVRSREPDARVLGARRGTAMRASAGRTAMFSNRLPGYAEINALSRGGRRPSRRAGTPLVDLTESNPTRAGSPIRTICSAAAVASGAALRAAAARPALGA